MPPVGGGIGTYVAATADLFAGYGHNVTVFVHRSDQKEKYVQENGGVRFVYFSEVNYSTNGLLGYHAQVSWAFSCVVQEYMELEGVPDLLESQEYLGIAYYTLQKKHLKYPFFSELRVLVTCHAPAFVYLEYNHFSTYEFPNFWVCEMEKFVLSAADLIISPSDYIVQQIKLRSVALCSVYHRILNPINGLAADKANASFQRGLIVCFGKLSPLKGSFRLLDDLKQMWDEGFHYRIVLVGGYQHMHVPEGCTAREFIELKYGAYIKAGLIELKGALEQPEAMKLIQRANVVVVPSLVDNLPYTVLESMCYARVVLASKQGGHREIINHGRNGFLFDHNIPRDFSNKLKEIMALDEQQHKLIGLEAAGDIITHFSSAKIYNEKIAVIEELIKKDTTPSVFPFTRLRNFKSKEYENSSTEAIKVSVVVPYFNLGAYIDATISSINNSTYSNIEIIIVNDGSTDRASVDKLKEYDEQKNIHVVNTENRGLAQARNTGAAFASGTYLLFLDADDLVEPEFITKGVNVLQHYDNVHFVTTWLFYFDGAQGGWPCFNPEPPYLLVHNMVSCSILVLRSSFLRHGKNDSNLVYGMEDWDMVLGLVANGCYGVVLPEQLIGYRVRRDSMTRKFNRSKKLFSFKYITEKYHEALSQYAVDVAGLLHANGSGLNFDNPSMGAPDHYKFQIGPVSWSVSQRVKQRILRSRALSKFAFFVYKFLKRRS